MNGIMVSRLDIERSALLLVKQHGNHAADKACDRLRSFLAKGDREGASLWLEIMTTLDQLLADDPNATRH